MLVTGQLKILRTSYKMRGVGNLAMRDIAFPTRKLTCRFPHFYQFLSGEGKNRG
jgi:hypothetical protein